jgi:hypothetical protein
MKQLGGKKKPKKSGDYIEGGRIVLDAWGVFPKLMVFREPGRDQEYKLVKTSKNKFLLIK